MQKKERERTMVVTREIGTYTVMLLDGEAEADCGHAGFVYLYAPSGAYLGYVCGMRDSEPLPDAVRHRNGIVHIYVRETEMLALINMMQNEPTVLLYYNAAHGRGTVSPAAISRGARRADHAAQPGRTERTLLQA